MRDERKKNKIKNCINYIHEKAESRGYENAYYYAEIEFGEEIAKLAWEQIIK